MTHNLTSQRQLMQSSKLAAIGELATNIAYEVNNPLTGVLGYTGLLLKADDIPADKKEYLKTVERETLRAREILKNLLDFSRRKPPRLVKADMSMVVQDTIPLVKGQAKLNNVAITASCNGILPQVAIDVDEIRQVFVNLINNACFAMPKGGSLDIQCRAERDSAVVNPSSWNFPIRAMGSPKNIWIKYSIRSFPPGRMAGVPGWGCRSVT
jgi:two-component system NtrC family sensor kinase